MLHYGTLIASTVILAGVYFGVSQRRRRHVHIPVMLSCFVADMLLVLVIELNRGAVHQAVTTTDALLRFHVAVSISAVVGWLVALFTGYHRRHGRFRRLHLANAGFFLLCRTLNWVTAFFVAGGATGSGAGGS